MDISVWPDNGRSFEDTKSIVSTCEGFGWHAAYYADHFMPNGPDATPLRGETFEALTTLAALAASTSSIRLGTLVASATYRHPAVFAKSLCTLDHLSGGRMIAGLGAGWQQNEHASYGIALGTIAERVSRFEEYVEIVASLLSQDATTFSGEYYELRDAPCDPRPVQSPLPILLGVRGAKRTTKLAARFAATWNAWTTPDDLASLNQVLDTHCASFDREPGTLRRSTQALVFVSHDESWLAKHRSTGPGVPTVAGTPEEVLNVLGAYREAGCDEFIVPTWWTGDLSRVLDTLALLQEEVVTQLT